MTISEKKCVCIKLMKQQWSYTEIEIQTNDSWQQLCVFNFFKTGIDQPEGFCEESVEVSS